MNDIHSIGFALDPNGIPTFLLDWEVTRLCNLDCTYCGLAGHDNSTKHPPLDECLRTIDFMYEYVNLYMQHKKHTQRKVTLNVYGGESLFHPNIIEILNACREKYAPYKDLWHLTITCTTNAIVGKNQWERIVPLVDEFSVSYHAENLPKQKQQYLDNILYLKEHNKRFKCIIMMHNKPELFKDAETVVEFCKEHNMRYLTKPLDGPGPEWSYSKDQFTVLKNFWISKTSESQKLEYKKKIDIVGTNEKIESINEGRACCGGRQLSLNSDLKSNVSFVPKQGFEGWSCSVNWFFLFVQQLSGEVYTNKDCRTSTTGRVEPLGNINNYSKILDTLKQQLENNNMPIIECIKKTCTCGFCAPKASTKEEFMQLIKRHVPVDVFQKEC